ncbi:MAG TPA: type IV pilus secretin PilQ [Casimicrobiaceae bacterium]|jgi:type IV pilus assembly protein PilQ|nr:type IV pilus secretin PilQ [Casimicrobiaceae bacterium]
MSPLPSTGSPRRRCRVWATMLAAATVAVFATAPVLAQTLNSIDNLSVSKTTSGRTVVKFTLKAPLANPPAGFTIANPPRIALDFLDTGNGLGRSAQDIGDATLRSVNVVQAGSRTRVVFNLNKPQTFETHVEGNTVLVTLADQSGVAGSPETSVVSRFAEARPGEASHTLRDVDFRRGKNGEGRIIVDLSDSTTGIDIRQQGRTLVVDFLRTTLPRNLERRLDVGDFATPVATIDTFTQGSNTRMVIEPRGLWEHSAYQTDNRFILEIKPIQEDPNKLTQGSRQGYKGEKLSLNFQNVEVRAVLQVIADFTGLNIITSDTVTGSLTLRLKDIPWDQALDIIMQTKGLDMRKNGNVVLIAPREELALKEKQALESRQQISDLEPLQTESFQLNYQKARDVKNLLDGVSTSVSANITGPQGNTATVSSGGNRGQRFLSPRGTSVFDERTNTLFVQDTASRLEEVRRLIRQIDVPVRQVLIESRIVIASDTFSRQLGVRLGVQTGFTFGSRYSAGIGGSLSTQPVVTCTSTGTGSAQTCTRTTNTQTPFELASGIASAGYSNPEQLNVNLPVPSPAGQLALTLINLGSGNLVNLELSALEADTLGKVVSRPRVVTADNGKAHIEQGTEIPYIVNGTLTTAPTVEFKNAVLSLDVTPQITPDNHIIMRVEVRDDTVGQTVIIQGSEYPAIDTKSVVTQIMVNNGDTAVIGGIYQETVNNNVTKVPFLGDIPVLGYLFKQTSKDIEKTELLIFLTPRVVKEAVTAER